VIERRGRETDRAHDDVVTLAGQGRSGRRSRVGAVLIGIDIGQDDAWAIYGDR
jgi:hypothetical protein